MSHFYGTLQGSRGEATRCGAKSSGIRTVAASWKGAITVGLYYDEETKQDCFWVRQDQWHCKGCSETLAKGIVGQPIRQDGAS